VVSSTQWRDYSLYKIMRRYPTHPARLRKEKKIEKKKENREKRKRRETKRREREERRKEKVREEIEYGKKYWILLLKIIFIDKLLIVVEL
jgi:hypothetical protein